MRPFFVSAAAVLGVASSGFLFCDQHVQSNGTYALTVTSVLRDDCKIAPDGGQLGDTALTVTGDDIQMTYGPSQVHLTGEFEVSVEAFDLAGDEANVEEPVGGNMCLVDLADVQLHGSTDSADSFHGTLRLSYETSSPSTCTCKFWASYTAQRR